jgi:hypothetical protein
MYGSTDPFLIAISLLDDIGEGLYKRSLEPIGEAIRSSNEYIGRQPSGDENADYLVECEGEVIETLLDAAFVVCQAYITAVVSHAKYCANICKRHSPSVTLCTGKKDVIKIGRVMVGGSGYGQVEVIDAFANYFKHHEEEGWQPDWSIAPTSGNDPRGKCWDAIQCLTAVGARQSYPNMRIGTNALGIQDIGKVDALVDMLSNWRKAVQQDLEQQMRQHNLIIT